MNNNGNGKRKNPYRGKLADILEFRGEKEGLTVIFSLYFKLPGFKEEVRICGTSSELIEESKRLGIERNHVQFLDIFRG